MKFLNKDELRTLEGVLLQRLPKTYMLYGLLYNVNRNKLNTMDVFVDSWPHFKVIICRSDPKLNFAPELMTSVTCHCADEKALREMLINDNLLDWSTRFVIRGFDMTHATMLKEISSERDVTLSCKAVVHLMYLADSSHLLTPTVDSDLESRISSLKLSHVDLVNKTWKFGGNEQSYNIIKKLISNFPSYCITDGLGQPLSWILLYHYSAMGILYTLPEHRGKGYAKVLVSTMAKMLSAEGLPVFCFIEEENIISYRLFKNLGFTENPSYRGGWFYLNQ